MTYLDKIKQMNAQELAETIVYKSSLNAISKYFYEINKNLTLEEMQIYIIKSFLESEVEE